MNKYNFKKVIKTALGVTLLLGGVGGGLTSCEDMMTVETGDKAYVNAQDTLYSYLGIMRCMQDVAERQIILGEIRGDLVTSTEYTTDTLFAISNFDDPQDQTCTMLQVSDYYNVINNCNFYIANADTNAIKSNIKYMIPEYAQVKSIRAWAYLQLVKNYGAVPYITEPVSSLDVIKNFDYNKNLVDKNNLADKFIEDGLLNLVDTRYPQYGNTSSTYGSWNNGYTGISARMCFIPIRLVLGDTYLLRGADTSDYEKAAKFYFDYLKNETAPLAEQYCTAIERFGDITYSQSGAWGTWAESYNYNAATNEVITVIPGSANAGLGKMLTRVADIFGYTPSSSQSSDITAGTDGNKTDANGATEYQSAGAISVSYNYKRQYGPSGAYSAINDAQTYVDYKAAANSTANPEASFIENCDARYGQSIYRLSYEGESYPLCSKAAKGGRFYYTIPIYRKTLVWLRLAEAINRAGYPEFAFAILKDGINQYSIPRPQERFILNPIMSTIDGKEYFTLYNSSTEETIYAEETEELINYYHYDADGNWGEYTGSLNKFKMVSDTTFYMALNYGNHNAMHYIHDMKTVEDFNNFLNFGDDIWNSTYGIHAKGCGYGRWTSSNQGERVTNISGDLDDGKYDYLTLVAEKLANHKALNAKSDTINAVEDIIVDELALETAFEGNRFTDLIRIAEHKNASGYEGTEWLAKKIANRSYRPATPKTPETGGFDNALYSKLKDTKNWYFSLPKWDAK